MKSPELALNTLPRPDSASVLSSRMLELIQRGQIDAAEMLLPALERMAGHYEDSVIVRTQIALARGALAQARQLADEGASGHGSARINCLRARICLAQHDQVAAAISAADALLSVPSSAEAKSLLGQAMIGLNRMVEAEACLREACAALPHDVLSLSAFAQVAPVEAEPLLRSALARNGASSRLRHALIRSLVTQNRLDDAKLEIESRQRGNDDDIQYQLFAIEIAGLQGDWEQALSLCSGTESHQTVHV